MRTFGWMMLLVAVGILGFITWIVVHEHITTPAYLVLGGVVAGTFIANGVSVLNRHPRKATP